MAAEHGCQNVVTAVLDVSSNIVKLRYAVFFGGRPPLLRSHVERVSHIKSQKEVRKRSYQNFTALKTPI